MKLKTGTAVLITACLVVFAFVFGAYQGWTNEKAQVNEAYPGLESMLQYRVEAANNLLTVARRHLSADDELVKKVAEDKDALSGRQGLKEMKKKAAANEKLTEDAEALLQKLAATDSVRTYNRDLMYVENTIRQQFSESELKAAGAQYNEAAKAFNDSLQGSFSGWIARLLRVGPVEEFSAQ